MQLKARVNRPRDLDYGQSLLVIPERKEDFSSQLHERFHGVWEAVIYVFARQYFRMFSLHNLVHKSFSSQMVYVHAPDSQN